MSGKVFLKRAPGCILYSPNKVTKKCSPNKSSLVLKAVTGAELEEHWVEYLEIFLYPSLLEAVGLG